MILWVQSYNFYRFESLNHSSELGHIRFGVIKMANVEMKDAYIEENESNHVIFVPDVNHNIPVIKFLPRIDFWRALKLLLVDTYGLFSYHFIIFLTSFSSAQIELYLVIWRIISSSRINIGDHSPYSLRVSGIILFRRFWFLILNLFFILDLWVLW